MSDKSLGDNVNKNIVKNPLLSTAVTGLSFEDLTHNAVLVPVAPNQGVITGLDLSGSYTQTLANPDNEPIKIQSSDSNLNQQHVLPPQSSISTYPHNLESYTSHQYDNIPERSISTVSKASAKSEDDFDVNEYFARLQGTRYVSAPIHSHTDPNANLAATEENLEEINLNDDKTVEVQQSLTADIAQNFSQLPNVLPHVASAVFSSFSNMWNMKSREQTPDDKAQSYHDVQFQIGHNPSQLHKHQPQSYQEVQFQGGQAPGLNQYQGLDMNVPSVPMMASDDVVKEVAPPPKEPPACGTSNFRLPTKKKYAQIPGLWTKESQPIVFNPMAQNVPSYFIPTEEPSREIEENKLVFPQESSNLVMEQKQENLNEPSHILSATDNIAARDIEPIMYLPTENKEKMFEETASINFQNNVPVIPPPPMFSSQRRGSQTGKAVLPPSVARRIGSNNPVIKQQTIEPSDVSRIFVPSFESTSTPESYTSHTDHLTPQKPMDSSEMFISTHQSAPLHPQEIPSALTAPVQQPLQLQTHVDRMKLLPEDQTRIFNPYAQQTAPDIFTPGIPILTSDYTTVPSIPPFSSIAASNTESIPLPPSSNLFSTPTSATNILSGPMPPATSTEILLPSSVINPPPTMFNTSAKQDTISESTKPPIKPPKASVASNFRMIKKRPQYYAGPIEGMGSISNSVKPIIPTIEPGTFHGALFTPEQSVPDQSAPLFDINLQTETDNLYTPFDINSTAKNTESANPGQQPPYHNYDRTQTSQNFSQHYNTVFDVSRPTITSNYENDESKGFGIIGSLKSKLSSIDINKIQNSVTTFFDPGYNDIRKDDEAAQKNVTYNPTQYQTQTNFEIFVPNIQDSQPQSYSFQTNQPAHVQSHQEYSYSYFTQPDSNYVSSITAYQPIAENIYAVQTDTLNQPSLPIIEKSAMAQPTEANDFPQIYKNVDKYLNKNSKNSDDTQSEYNPVKYQENISLVDTALTSNINTCEKSQLLQYIERQDETSNKEEATHPIENNPSLSEPELLKIPQARETLSQPAAIIPSHNHELYKDSFINYSKSNVPIADASMLFETSNKYRFDTATSIEGNTFGMSTQSINFELPSQPYRKVSMDDSKKSDISNYMPQQVSSFGNISALSSTEKQGKTTDVLPKITQEVKDTAPILKDSLLESLTKEGTPLLAVSSVPLFGLSTIIVDKTKQCIESKTEKSLPLYERCKGKDIMDKNINTSLFENNPPPPIQKGGKRRDSKNIDILDINPNSGFFIKDSIKTDELDAQISSSCFFTNDQIREKYVVDPILDKKQSLYASNKSTDFGLNIDSVDRENKHIEGDAVMQSDMLNITELNMCETCREVSKPEDKETEDVTSQLIENINSPIQLSNAVEVPLTEGVNIDRIEFDTSQSEEISHISEETIETIHAHSAVELLDDSDANVINYGWTTEKYGTDLLKPHDYGYNMKPVNLFGESLFVDNVPANASDELKAEFKHQEDLLPRQMSIPSAPPAEDLKSEEAVLDVQSIELDAKQDFPIYEEFVIEPSETDDDKIEYKKEKTEEIEPDSFTNRVEKFKKMEEVSDLDELKEMQKNIELPAHPIGMASYFDTGNYAAETHYKNTIQSPHISIPPGFEEEFRKRLALAKSMKDTMKVIPNTSTQTAASDTISFSIGQSNLNTFNVMPVGFNVEENVSNIVEDKVDYFSQTTFGGERSFDDVPVTATTFSTGNLKMSHVPSIYPSEEIIVPNNTYAFGSNDKEILESSSIFGAGDPRISEITNISVTEEAKMPITSYLFGSGEIEIPKVSKIFDSCEAATLDTSKLSFAEASIPGTIPFDSIKPAKSEIGPYFRKISTEKEPIKPNLPDPMNFFTETTVAPTENFNRLASYFSSPPKTEHAKSFFELSQSQNHYRHEINNDKYEDLIKDLTSVQNLAVSTDQVIRHVNYFTVEYDTVIPESKGLFVESDDKYLDFLSSCRYCVDLIYDKNFKVKTAVNDSKGSSNTVPKMENVASTNRKSVTVHFDGTPMSEESNEGVAGITESRSSSEYAPVKHHWFYRVDVEDKSIWRGFSVIDSRALETSFLSPELNESTLVPTDGGRYDVNIVGRLRIPVYWTDKPTNVRRCSWFYKGTTDPRYVPYTESVAEKLEVEYQHGVTTGEWHRRLLLPNGEVVVMHGPSVMVHFLHSDAFSTPPQSTSRPRVVRRGHDDSEIEDAEPSSIDHLLLLCHGVGSACDMRFRSVEEVVEDFRATSLQLVQSHYRNSYDQGVVSRVEVLPISWHATLHSGEMGVDRRLSQITLDSIPRLRNFTNDTVLDVLFYTSPVFCQTITDTVCQELNRIYKLFRSRNPGFKGGISLGGHSLGSVILYDLLCHQTPGAQSPTRDSSDKSYVNGSAGSCQSHLQYPSLDFEPDALYALGSPIAIFECIRGVESLGSDFCLPTCKNFFNIFHPYDPIAYRIEPLINSRLKELKPYLIPHHKGRKRMHLELKDTMARVGADIKQKLMESLRSTWNKWKAQPTDGNLERVVEENLDRELLCDPSKEELAKERELSTPEMLGRLNSGRRVDYVLQEAPLEMINEYLFAMSSHVGYWESEDTMLLMLREIYSALGVQPDSTMPPPSMTVQRSRSQDATVIITDKPSTSGGVH